MKDKGLRKYLDVKTDSNGEIFTIKRIDKISNRIDQVQHAFYTDRTEQRIKMEDTINDHSDFINRKLDLLAEKMGLQFKYREDNPEIELMDRHLNIEEEKNND